MRITFVCPSTPEPVGGVRVLYELANRLVTRGHRVHLVHGPIFGERVNSLDEIRGFRFEPALVHWFRPHDTPDLPQADVIFGSGARPELGLPVVLIQGIDMFTASVEREAFRTPALKLAVASWLVEAVGRFGVPPGQVHVIPVGIDHDRFHPATPLHERTIDVAILHHPHPAKGWEVGVQALHELRRRRPDLRCVAFGTVDRPDDLPPWAAYLRSPGPDEVAAEVYGASRVFLQSSNHEGLGLTAVEAMACGCALVTTDNGGSDDYAVEGVTALLRPPGDAVGLAEAVDRLLGDEATRTRLALAGRERSQSFDWDRAAARVEDLLERYVADPQAFLQSSEPIDPVRRSGTGSRPTVPPGRPSAAGERWTPRTPA